VTVFDPKLYDKVTPTTKRELEEVELEEVEGTPTPGAAVERYFTPPDEVEEVEGMVFDPGLYDMVLAQPEGFAHRQYLKVLGRYVSTLSTFERFQIQSRREEIEATELEWKELNHEVLRRLGFNEAEAGMLMDKRLDSPGMRNVIRKRADAIKKGAKAKAILREMG